jgi:glucose-6-phosphate isomerase
MPRPRGSWIADALGEGAVPRAFRRALDQSRQGLRRLRHQVGPDLRLLGLGRRPLFGLVGHRPAGGDCRRAENFEAFLKGAYEMDQHFLKTKLEKNLPVIMGLLGVWYRNAWGFSAHAVLPYDQRLSALRRLSAAAGHGIERQVGRQADGKPVDYSTGPLVWGEPGTNGQHAFYQLIHQGTDVIPADFLVAAQPHESLPPHHDKLVANVLAQAEALMLGKTKAEVVAELAAQGMDKARIKELTPHKMFPGNRPSNVLMYPKLTPERLGSLVALYEHKVFVQGTIWGVNSYDQWGVELGKQLAKALLPRVEGKAKADGHDSSTKGLVEAYLKLK